MNNSNRGNNNRRRGRGNRQQGGGQPLNRIDSRARGNAPQLLEKYRKLAQDAHLNGDRVQAEYYLQFADHYFRVLADSRARQEEPRVRRDDRWQDVSEDEGDSGDFAADADFPSFDQPTSARREREDRPRGERGPRPERSDRPEREERADRAEAPRRDVEDAAAANPYEPAENPFLRENRGSRGLRPRREGRGPARDPAGDQDSDRGEGEPAGLDPSSLPPAISSVRDEGASAAEAEAAKPRRRTVRRKPSADDAGEALESVN